MNRRFLLLMLGVAGLGLIVAKVAGLVPSPGHEAAQRMTREQALALQKKHEDSLTAAQLDEKRNRLARIQAGEILESRIPRSFETDLETIRDDLKPMEKLSSRLTKPASWVNESAAGLTFIGGMLEGSPRGWRRDGLRRIYQSESVGVVVLEEYDLAYVQVITSPESLNTEVSGHPASLVKKHDSRSGVSIGSLVWLANGRRYSLKIGKIDEASLAQLKVIASSIADTVPRSN